MSAVYITLHSMHLVKKHYIQLLFYIHTCAIFVKFLLHLTEYTLTTDINCVFCAFSVHQLYIRNVFLETAFFLDHNFAQNVLFVY